MTDGLALPLGVLTELLDRAAIPHTIISKLEWSKAGNAQRQLI